MRNVEKVKNIILNDYYNLECCFKKKKYFQRQICMCSIRYSSVEIRLNARCTLTDFRACGINIF